MQHQGDRPVRHGRPSLLSPDEQAVPERQGILSSLDGMRTPAGATLRPRARSRALAWGGAAVGAIVVGAALFVSGADRQAAPVAALAAAAVPAARDVPVPMPAPAVLRDEPAPPAPNPLADMAAPAARGAEVSDRVTRALEQPERHQARAEKTGRKDAQAVRRSARAPAHDKPKDRPPQKRPKARTMPAPDSDVVLLAALVSHIEPKRGKATPAEQLEACRRYNAAGAAQCRARVCADAGRKEAACRRGQAARTDQEI